MNKNRLGIKIFLSCLCFLFIFSLPAFAIGLEDAFKTKDKSANDALDAAAGRAGYNITAEASDINAIISTIIQSILGLLGVIFLILIIYGGITWMTAEGEEAKVEKAQKIIRSAIIGLIIVISAYAISYFVINALSQKALI
jgi:hypothetical protein